MEFQKLPSAFCYPAGQVATVGQSDAQLFAALARAAERRVGDFKCAESCQHSMAAWACATLGQSDV